jgi:hypothetical protein
MSYIANRQHTYAEQASEHAELCRMPSSSTMFLLTTHPSCGRCLLLQHVCNTMNTFIAAA